MDKLLARDKSAMESVSPTKNFLPFTCFSKNYKNLFKSAINFEKSILWPFTWFEIALTEGSKSQVIRSNHWSINAWLCRFPLPYSSILFAVAKYLAIVFEAKKVPSAVSKRGKVPTADNLEMSSPNL